MEAVAFEREYRAPTAFVPGSNAPRFPYGSACAVAVAGEAKKNAAGAAVTVAVVLAANGGMLDRFARRVPARSEEHSYTGAANHQRGLDRPGDTDFGEEDESRGSRYRYCYRAAPKQEMPMRLQGPAQSPLPNSS